MGIFKITNQQQLIDYVDQENRVKYLYFWGHQPSQDDQRSEQAPSFHGGVISDLIDKSCFSQWYTAPFQLDNIEYQTAEHYMMGEKARLFGDREILAKIISASTPGEVKKLGRLVNNFKQEIWLEHRFLIVVRGNLAKFEQNEALEKFLINTNQRILVEASPRDRIWGIGLDQNHPHAADPHKWQGLNLLGFALMVVRNIRQGTSKMTDYYSQ